MQQQEQPSKELVEALNSCAFSSSGDVNIALSMTPEEHQAEINKLEAQLAELAVSAKEQFSALRPEMLPKNSLTKVDSCYQDCLCSWVDVYKWEHQHDFSTPIFPEYGWNQVECHAKYCSKWMEIKQQLLQHMTVVDQVLSSSKIGMRSIEKFAADVVTCADTAATGTLLCNARLEFVAGNGNYSQSPFEHPIDMFNDMVLVSNDGRQFPCHKCIWATESNQLLKLLEAAGGNTITLPQLSATATQSLLEFIYVGSVSCLNMEDCADLHYFSKVNGLDGLASYSLTFPVRSIRENCYRTYQRALSYNDSELFERILTFWADNISRCVTQPWFGELDAPVVSQIFQSPGLNSCDWDRSEKRNWAFFKYWLQLKEPNLKSQQMLVSSALSQCTRFLVEAMEAKDVAEVCDDPVFDSSWVEFLLSVLKRRACGESPQKRH
ncbi:hypothetical protein Pelo_10306 [Pelomyxa schiedti]|nr:hypothetical protein Pelo_10306 [Pelomyxa schiedti]